MILLAVDPSIKSAGAAIFEDSSLVHATTITEPRGRTKRPSVERCLWMAQQIANWVLSRAARPNEFATEWPKVYAPGKGKGDPTKTLLGLAGVATAIAAILDNTPALRPLSGDLSVFSYLPSDWAGSVPKASGRGWRGSVRYRRIYSRLNSHERDIWDRDVDSDDAMDAAGIGLHHLGRYERRRIFPGAT